MAGAKLLIRRRSRWACKLRAVVILAIALGSLCGHEPRAYGQAQLPRQPVSSELLVIQGRITGIQGVVATVKTPDGFPGGPGIHAQFVTSGPSFKVDVSRARVLLPDGKQTDKVPLAVGDRVLMVLNLPDSGPPVSFSPTNNNQIYFASTIERVVQSDTIVSH
jgi:hypothetical protein